MGQLFQSSPLTGMLPRGPASHRPTRRQVGQRCQLPTRRGQLIAGTHSSVSRAVLCFFPAWTGSRWPDPPWLRDSVANWSRCGPSASQAASSKINRFPVANWSPRPLYTLFVSRRLSASHPCYLLGTNLSPPSSHWFSTKSWALYRLIHSSTQPLGFEVCTPPGSSSIKEEPREKTGRCRRPWTSPPFSPRCGRGWLPGRVPSCHGIDGWRRPPIRTQFLIGNLCSLRGCHASWPKLRAARFMVWSLPCCSHGCLLWEVLFGFWYWLPMCGVGGSGHGLRREWCLAPPCVGRHRRTRGLTSEGGGALPFDQNGWLRLDLRYWITVTAGSTWTVGFEPSDLPPSGLMRAVGSDRMAQSNESFIIKSEPLNFNPAVEIAYHIISV
jgi:hypothetical protein